MAQLDTLSLNSLPDLSRSLCHPPPVSPSKIHLAEKLAAGVEGIRAERRWRLMALAPSPGPRRSPRETWPDQSERPVSPPPPLLPLTPPPRLSRPTPAEHTVRALRVQKRPQAPWGRSSWRGHLLFVLLQTSRKPRRPPASPALTSTSAALLPPHFRSGLCTSSPPQGPDSPQCQPVPPFQDP